MQEDPRLLCPDCGKARSEKKGSITEWIGLGDACRCGLQADLASTAQNQKRGSKTKKRCKRCQKPLPSHSMTQWLFRSAICQCEPEASISENYAQKAIRRAEILGSRQVAESLHVIAFLAFTIVVLLAICSYLVFQTNVIHRDRNSPVAHSKGLMRTLVCKCGKEGLKVPLTNDGLATIPRNKKVDVGIFDSTLSDDELKVIATVPSITALRLRNCDGFTAEGLRSLENLAALDWLSLESSELGAGSLQALGNLHVSTLDLSHTKIAGKPWNDLLRNRNLGYLIIHGVDINNFNERCLNEAGFLREAGCFSK